jgi:crotonobetainyl-CoA:carnitine CoA-transferase CaiB-like acyl-CoA transferase
MGAAHPSIVPYQSFKTGDDKYILIAAGNDRLYKMLCETIGKPELVDDSDYLTNDDRVAHRKILIPILEIALMEKPRDHWLEKLREKGFPCAPVYTLDEVFSDPQVQHREMVVEMDHPSAGKIKQIGTPFKLATSKTKLTTPPPELSEHTEMVLSELGYSGAEIKALKEKGVI